MFDYNLQPCPRCGFKAYIEVRPETSPLEYKVQCGNEECKLCTSSFILMEDAIVEWNKLCNASAAKGDYEGLVRALEDYLNHTLNRLNNERLADRLENGRETKTYVRLTHKIAGIVHVIRKLKSLKKEFNISDEES